MKTVGTDTRIALKKVLFLTDFSEPSEAALPFAVAVARGYGAAVHAFHVLTPRAYTNVNPDTIALALEAQEEAARAEMLRVDANLAGVAHDWSIARGVDVGEQVAREARTCDADLIVVGTHGRAGAQRFLLGSVAEDIFRRSPIPVLTIGPHVRKGMHGAAHFHRVLFATDFTAHSLAAAPYAISLAQENQARLILLHVMREPNASNFAAAAAEELQRLVPESAQFWCQPENVVAYGEPAEQILRAADDRDADLIVMGVRDTVHLGTATHLARATAHAVVARANCPVLTVRG